MRGIGKRTFEKFRRRVTSVLAGASNPSQILNDLDAISSAAFTCEELELIDEIAKNSES